MIHPPPRHSSFSAACQCDAASAARDRATADRDDAVQVRVSDRSIAPNFLLHARTRRKRRKLIDRRPDVTANFRRP